MEELENWLTVDDITLQQLLSVANATSFPSDGTSRPSSVKAPVDGDLRIEEVTSNLHSNRASPTPPRKTFKDTTEHTKSLNMFLVPMVDMPSPTLTAAIITVKKIVDGIVLLNIPNKSYMQYNIVVRQSRLEWIITRRYSGMTVYLL